MAAVFRRISLFDHNGRRADHGNRGVRGVACKSFSARGTFADDKTVTGLELELSECERAGQKCSSLGETQGNVTASRLVGMLGMAKLGKTPKKDEVGLELSRCPARSPKSRAAPRR